MTAPNLWITRAGGPTIGFGLSDDSTTTRSTGTGSGGWQIVDRPRRGVTTEWVDYGQWQLTISLIMDGFTGGSGGQRSLEGDIAIVEAWELPVAGSNPPLPPTLTVRGPVPHNEVTWVAQSVIWKGAIRDTQSGVRWQQMLDIVLWEYRPATVAITAGSPALAALLGSSGTSGAPAAAYTVKVGDTLLTIATALYGSWTFWTLLANANIIRDPNSVTAGQVLTVPAKSFVPPALFAGTGRSVNNGG